MTDSELIHSFLGGSQPAFALLVRRHADWVYSIARRRVRDAHLAEDVTQAVFVVLARKAHRLRDDTVLPAWLFQVTRLSVSRALRDRARRQRRETIAAAARRDELSLRESTPSSDIWNDIEPLLDESVARLRESDRTAVLLRFYQRKSFGEVGAAIGTTEDGARKRVGRAIERLREMFVARGVSVSAIALPQALIEQTTTPAPDSFATLASNLAIEHARVSAIQLAKGAILMMQMQKLRISILAVTIVLMCTALGIAMIRRATTFAEAANAEPTTAPAAATPVPNKVMQVTPILSVQDMPTSLDFYVNTLGFQKLWEYGDPADFAAIARDGCTIYLSQDGRQNSQMWIYVAVHDVNAMHVEVAGRGAKIETEPVDRPWGMREMVLEDPDGNRIRFGSVRGVAENPVRREK